jgi:riboflavin kinase/FMN adenylyltransferase
MLLIRNLDELHEPLLRPVLTIGNFDGVHRGHLALFERVKERAKAIEGQSAVMTFDPHPLKLLRPQEAPAIITPSPKKIELIEKAGIDVVFCLNFTDGFAAIGAEDFVRDILVGRVGIKEIVVGYDYVFGHARKGDISLLKKLGQEMGFLVHVIPPISLDGNTVSSTAVRSMLKDGNMRDASAMLGRFHEISGVVIKGMNRGGRLLGFPTANLKSQDELIPRSGVYAARARLEDGIYDAVVNIGYNPTFPEKNFSIEAHLLEFSGDLVGKPLSLILIERIRDEVTFKDVESLAAQIARDVDSAKKVLKTAPSS